MMSVNNHASPGMKRSPVSKKPPVPKRSAMKQRSAYGGGGGGGYDDYDGYGYDDRYGGGGGGHAYRPDRRAGHGMDYEPRRPDDYRRMLGENGKYLMLGSLGVDTDTEEHRKARLVERLRSLTGKLASRTRSRLKGASQEGEAAAGVQGTAAAKIRH